jgi:hypothetical protein
MPAVTPADIGAELWPQFGAGAAEPEPSPAPVETPEWRPEVPRQSEPPALAEAEARVERREPEPLPPAPLPEAPPPEAPAPEAQAEEPPVPKRSGWWRRR